MSQKKKAKLGSLGDRDEQAIWHPYTQHQTARLPLIVNSAKGAEVFDTSGRPLIDMISSWWVNIHGHGRPEIADAVATQIRKLDHVHFAGATHEPAVKLAEELLTRSRMPSGSKTFYSDNGSTAVEVALKIAYQLWKNRGQHRKIIAAFRGGYHGDTLAAMSVGESSGFFDKFRDWLLAVEFIDVPLTWRGKDTDIEEARLLAELDDLLSKKGKDFAALIVEPLVQGAAGMRFHKPTFLFEVCRRFQKAEVPVIFDEVMTGFGRTGTFLAADQCGFSPQMICLSKALTGGILPMGATLVQKTLFDEFLGKDFSSALAHGHSFTGNPVACAAALTSLEIFDQTDALTLVNDLSASLNAGMDRLSHLPQLIRRRVLGGIAAFEIDGLASDYASAAGGDLASFAERRGVIIRPLGNVVYLMPPYCVSQPQLDLVFQVLLEYFSKKD